MFVDVKNEWEAVDSAVTWILWSFSRVVEMCQVNCQQIDNFKSFCFEIMILRRRQLTLFLSSAACQLAPPSLSFLVFKPLFEEPLNFWSAIFEKLFGVFKNLTIFKSSKQKCLKGLLDGDKRRALRFSLSSPEHYGFKVLQCFFLLTEALKSAVNVLFRLFIVFRMLLTLQNTPGPRLTNYKVAWELPKPPRMHSLSLRSALLSRLHGKLV